MPLSILLPMVIIGIAGIAILLHMLGLSRPARLGSEAAARAAWLREYPEFVPTRIFLSEDQGAALIETSQGQGIVWAVGSDTTARDLKDARMTRTATGLRIDLSDYTAPSVDLTLNSEETERWFELLKELA